MRWETAVPKKPPTLPPFAAPPPFSNAPLSPAYRTRCSHWMSAPSPSPTLPPLPLLPIPIPFPSSPSPLTLLPLLLSPPSPTTPPHQEVELHARAHDVVCCVHREGDGQPQARLLLRLRLELAVHAAAHGVVDVEGPHRVADVGGVERHLAGVRKGWGGGLQGLVLRSVAKQTAGVVLRVPMTDGVHRSSARGR